MTKNSIPMVRKHFLVLDSVPLSNIKDVKLNVSSIYTTLSSVPRIDIPIGYRFLENEEARFFVSEFVSNELGEGLFNWYHKSFKTPPTRGVLRVYEVDPFYSDFDKESKLISELIVDKVCITKFKITPSMDEKPKKCRFIEAEFEASILLKDHLVDMKQLNSRSASLANSIEKVLHISVISFLEQF